jgi:hypothetical protein
MQGTLSHDAAAHSVPETTVIRASRVAVARLHHIQAPREHGAVMIDSMDAQPSSHL